MSVITVFFTIYIFDRYDIFYYIYIELISKIIFLTVCLFRVFSETVGPIYGAFTGRQIILEGITKAAFIYHAYISFTKYYIN